jgi:RNA polymerase sigma-70 factor (ECF subfamily)
MKTDALENLLAELASGDDAAIEQAFIAFEPYLRMVVRRQLPADLRAKFDSVDIVQSVWVHILDGFREAGWRFENPAQLRAFLVRVTQNRFLDRVRQHQRKLRRERTLTPAAWESLPSARQPEPSEEAQAAELWERMVALCPPVHRRLLELKRQGLPLAEIAARTGLHPSSVRRILYDLAKQLVADSDVGTSKESSVPLSPERRTALSDSS